MDKQWVVLALSCFLDEKMTVYELQRYECVSFYFRQCKYAPGKQEVYSVVEYASGMNL